MVVDLRRCRGGMRRDVSRCRGERLGIGGAFEGCGVVCLRTGCGGVD